MPDALRALALVSVLVINALNYATAPWGPILGPRLPADSIPAALVQGVAGALLQGKGYAMLAFVFGMALWLSARARPRPAALRHGLRRNRRLLQLGVAHGVFVYFGDILTLYALVGRRLLRRLHMPWSPFRRHLRRALLWAVLAKLVFVGFIVAAPLWPAEAGTSSLASVQGALEFLRLNALAYAFSQVVAILLAAPVVYLCMAGGVAAARLRLLTHRRWRPLLRHALQRCGLPLLFLSLVYGIGYPLTEPSGWPHAWIDGLGDLIAIPVAGCYLAALALASSGGKAHWCQRLAPLGQRTLTLYVGHGLLCLLLFSGAGLGITLGTVQMVAYCLGLWLLAFVAASRSRGRRWPLEAWMGRG